MIFRFGVAGWLCLLVALAPAAFGAVACRDLRGAGACAPHSTQPQWHPAPQGLAFEARPELGGVRSSVQWREPTPPESSVEGVRDRWEAYNRRIFVFNDWSDRKILRPLAKGYREYMPKPVAAGLRNFVRNLREPIHLVNGLLQSDIDMAGRALGRLLFNSSVGLGGLIDVAGAAGLDYRRTGFGDTLEAWGVPSGPYFLLPLLAPGTLRDQFGRLPDSMLNGRYQLDNEVASSGLFAVDVMEARIKLLAADAFIVGDRYTAVRDLYYKNRENRARARRPATPDANEVSREAVEEPLFDDDF